MVELGHHLNLSIGRKEKQMATAQPTYAVKAAFSTSSCKFYISHTESPGRVKGELKVAAAAACGTDGCGSQVGERTYRVVETTLSSERGLGRPV